MKIENVPKEFQPNYKSTYPICSSGKNMEEIFFELSSNHNWKNKDSKYIYLPIFWSSYYVIHGYDSSMKNLYEYLKSLDTTKKYFTIVQSAVGVFVDNEYDNILVFSAGGGGINKKNNSIKKIKFNGWEREVFNGEIGNFILPLLYLPFPINFFLKKDILCSFVGRFDTHPCRITMRDKFKNNSSYLLMETTHYDEYINIMNRSKFGLCPRGYGYTSFRIFETIMCETIPIYIWENNITLPMNDEIEWSKICIIINSNELDKIPNLIENFDCDNALKIINNIKYKFFNFNYLCDYIINKL